MKSLALCMIVKNEEEMLGGCLESIKEFVDEMIVVDTGSTDSTKQIAVDHGAKVFDFEWINDFAAARNFSKAQTSCDYVIALDADERFDKAGGSELREKLNGSDARVGFIRLTNAKSIHSTVEAVLSGEDALSTATYLPRILKNVDGNDWKGRVHEAPEDSRSAIFTDADLVHLGGDQSFREEKGKSKRNLALLEQIVAEDPDQAPMFYSYLAGEREAAGNVRGFLEALETGWNKTLEYVESDQEYGHVNTGMISVYPAVLLAQNHYAEGFAALATLIKHLNVFSTNAVNTLWQVLQTCFQISFPQSERENFHRLTLDALDLLIGMDGISFAEPTINGVTTYKAYQMKVLLHAKLREFDEAFANLELAQQYEGEEVEYANQLMHLELLLEQGDMTSFLNIYTDILQDNLHTSPDVWVLGALSLVVLGKEEDVELYIKRAMDMPNQKFVSRHRTNILKGLFVRMSVLKGEPLSGPGAYGVVGAILSREPVETTHSIPSTLIQSVVDRYVELGKIEALLSFFDERAESILPGVGNLVQKRLEEYGVMLEDDGQKTPIVLLGADTTDILEILEGHERLKLLSFTEEETKEIAQELSAAEEQELDDLLFGDLDLLDDDEESKMEVTQQILKQKLEGVQLNPVIVWHADWPVSALESVCPSHKALFYVGSPTLHAEDSSGLYQWHLNNAAIPTALDSNLVYFNAKMLKLEPMQTLQAIMAKLGLDVGTFSPEMLEDVSWDSESLSSSFPSENDRDILKQWKFL